MSCLTVRCKGARHVPRNTPPSPPIQPPAVRPVVRAAGPVAGLLARHDGAATTSRRPARGSAIFLGFLTLEAVADATVKQNFASTNFGSELHLFTSWDAAGLYGARALIRFDLGALPADATIESATLTLLRPDDELLAAHAQPNAAVNVTAYTIRAAWSESRVTWTNQPEIGNGLGDPVATTSVSTPGYLHLERDQTRSMVGGEFELRSRAAHQQSRWGQCSAFRQSRKIRRQAAIDDPLFHPCQHAHGYRNADRHRDTNAYADADRRPDPTPTRTATRTVTVTMTPTRTRTVTTAPARTATPDSDPDAHSDTYSDPNAHSHAHSDTDSDGYSDPDAHAGERHGGRGGSLSWLGGERAHPLANHQPSLELHAGWTGIAAGDMSYIKFDISELEPHGCYKNATLGLYQIAAGQPTEYTLAIEAVQSGWEEDTITWNNAPSALDAGVTPLEVSNAAGWQIWDVTEVTGKWLNGSMVNNGLRMSGARLDDGTPIIGERAFGSRLSANPPRWMAEWVIDWIDPTIPTLSSSHPRDEWRRDSAVMMDWQSATDGEGCGIDGFSYLWSTLSEDKPDDSVDTHEKTLTQTLGQGEHWFHLRSLDRAGNWSETSHYGPVKIDTVAPSCAVAQLPDYVAPPTFEVRWSGADSRSGVADFDVQYRDGDGSWTNWQMGVTEREAISTGR